MVSGQGTRRVGRPRQAEGEALDRLILDVAGNLFCSRGLDATSIDAIAERCGTTRRSIYARYADKEALFARFCEQHCAEIVAYAGDEVVGDDEDHVLALRALCERMMTHALEPLNIGFHSRCTGEIGLRPALAERIIAMNDMLEKRIENRLLAAQRSGAFQRFSAAALATVLVGVMLSNPINRAAMGDPQFTDGHGAGLYFSQNWAIFLSMM